MAHGLMVCAIDSGAGGDLTGTARARGRESDRQGGQANGCWRRLPPSDRPSVNVSKPLCGRLKSEATGVTATLHARFMFNIGPHEARQEADIESTHFGEFL